MSIKFETIKGTLCRMVEPTPLRLDSEFPCVVRLIQDDSPMGIANSTECPHGLESILFATHIDDSLYPKLHHKKPNSSKDIRATTYYNFEIIGFPIKEGSHWWALYQTMNNGKIVTMDGCGIYKIEYGKLWECFPEDSNEWRVVADNGLDYWLQYINDPNGWTLYESEPTYNVGDWVEYGGKHYQIASVNHNCTFSGETLVMFNGVIWGVSDLTKLRKLKPSEVVVDFGSGIKGTIVGCSDIMPIVKVINSDLDWIASIMISSLDHETRKTVEQLLVAQEEK